MLPLEIFLSLLLSATNLANPQQNTAPKLSDLDGLLRRLTQEQIAITDSFLKLEQKEIILQQYSTPFEVKKSIPTLLGVADIDTNSYLNARIGYIPGGGDSSGCVKFLFAIDSTDRFEAGGLGNFTLMLFSRGRPCYSTEILVNNYNPSLNCVTSMPLDDMVFIPKVISGSIDDMVDGLLKILSIKKTDFNKLAELTNVLKKLSEYEQKQLDVQAGNIVTGGTVYAYSIEIDMDNVIRIPKIPILDLKGFRFLDPEINAGEEHCTLNQIAISIKIKRGEESILGYLIRGTRQEIRDKGWKGLVPGTYVKAFNVKTEYTTTAVSELPVKERVRALKY